VSKVWLIAGASRGLGRAFTEEALKAGHRVLATARNSGDLADLAGKFGESVRTVSLDVTNEAQAKYAVDAAIQTFGGLDILVNNAGYGNLSSVEDTSLADFRAQIETNLFGVIIMTKAVVPYFRERRAGHFIQISSIGGRVGPPGRAERQQGDTCCRHLSFSWLLSVRCRRPQRRNKHVSAMHGRTGIV
jgi:NAD(P)-dependent dehydrogenase (short-subunit alcohol dehydrogenase family)